MYTRELNQPAPRIKDISRRRVERSEDDANEDDEKEETQVREPASRKSLPRDHAGDDFWSIAGDLIIRNHRLPRISLFSPTDDDVPLPLKYFDVMRTTHTDLEDLAERRIDDIWYNSENPTLSSSWTGRTVFTLRSPQPLKGYTWVMGRLTKTQETTRPPTVLPEVRRTLSKKQKKKAISDWEHTKPARGKARKDRGIPEYVPDSDTEYDKIIAESRLKYSNQKAEMKI